MEAPNSARRVHHSPSDSTSKEQVSVFINAILFLYERKHEAEYNILYAEVTSDSVHQIHRHVIC